MKLACPPRNFLATRSPIDTAHHRAKRAEHQLQRADPGGNASRVHAALVDEPQLREGEAGKNQMDQHEANDREAQRGVAPNDAQHREHLRQEGCAAFLRCELAAVFLEQRQRQGDGDADDAQA